MSVFIGFASTPRQMRAIINGSRLHMETQPREFWQEVEIIASAQVVETRLTESARFPISTGAGH